jgi:hypothetical protein
LSNRLSQRSQIYPLTELFFRKFRHIGLGTNRD